MKTQELIDLVCIGIHPVIQFHKEMEVSETVLEENMRARLIGYTDVTDGMVKLRFDIKEFEDYNVPLMKFAYYDKERNPTLKSIETAFYPTGGIEDVFFYPQDDFPGEIMEENKLMAIYKASGSKNSYMTWLEKIVIDNLDAWVELEANLKKDISVMENLKEDKSAN